MLSRIGHEPCLDQYQSQGPALEACWMSYLWKNSSMPVFAATGHEYQNEDALLARGAG